MDTLERVRKLGVDVDRVIYSINTIDLVEVIDQAFEDTEKLSDRELLELITVLEDEAPESVEWFNGLSQALEYSDEYYRLLKKLNKEREG